MVDCFEQPENKINLVRNYNIIHHCKKCKKVINTFWDDTQLMGDFITEYAELSEYLGMVVSEPKDIICYRCYFGY
jgi:hypothetical protein